MFFTIKPYLVPFQMNQFSISMLLVLFTPEIGPDQVLPRLALVNLEAMAMKGDHVSQSPIITGTLPLDCLVSYQDTHWGVLPLCRRAVGVFYSPSRQAVYKHLISVA